MIIQAQDHNCLLTRFQELAKAGMHRITTMPEKSEVGVFWQDVLPFTKDEIAKHYTGKKPLILVQHGMHAYKDYLPPNDFPFLGDVYCCWGESDKAILEKTGKFKRIEVIGCPFLEYMDVRPVAHEGRNIFFSPAHWINLKDKSHNDNIEILNRIVNEIPFDRLFVKTMYNLPTQQYMLDGVKGAELVWTNPEFLEHYKTLTEYLSITDVMISVTEGTNEFLAYCYGIPVVVPWKVGPKEFIHGKKQDMNYSDAMKFGSRENFVLNYENCERDKNRQYALRHGALVSHRPPSSMRLLEICEEVHAEHK